MRYSKGENTRRMIIRESLQLFSVKGYYNTSINDIQEITGLTKGGLYAHFKSKEEIWWSAYEEAINIWKEIVFRDIKSILDPLERVNKMIDNDMRHYIGGNTFEGGCFFLNMLVELSGQSPEMSHRILQGFLNFAEMIKSWLMEAKNQGMLTKMKNPEQVAIFIVISLNGAAAFYAATKDPKFWELTIDQLRDYISEFKDNKH